MRGKICGLEDIAAERGSKGGKNGCSIRHSSKGRNDGDGDKDEKEAQQGECGGSIKYVCSEGEQGGG